MQGQTEITDYIARIDKASSKIRFKILENYNSLHLFDITKSDENSRKEEYYSKNFQTNPEYLELKLHLDIWCSIWFWPPSELNLCPSPLNYLNPPNDVRLAVKNLVEKYRFFHWELEFPDVFLCNDPGFNIILGNPPWETLQASSMEFFSEFDPIYRTYGKQEALLKQKEIFELDHHNELDWLNYTSFYKAIKNWIDYCKSPFGDYKEGDHFNLSPFVSNWKESQKMHDIWRDFRNKSKIRYNLQRKYSIQGSGHLYTYKIFIELGIINLSQKGRSGLIVPAGIYGDFGTKDIKEYIVEKLKWEFIFGIENRKKIFSSVDERFKFCIIIFQKGENTKEIFTAFMRRDLADWENSQNYLLQYEVKNLIKFSPLYKKFIEIENNQSLNIFEKLHSNKVLLNSQLSFYRELDPTDESESFKHRDKLENENYNRDNYGLWRDSDNHIALPIYEGRMVGQFDFSKKGWVSGKGRTAIWREISFSDKQIEPEFLILEEDCNRINKRIFGYKISFMKISSATNQRTIIAFLDRDTPHIDGCPVLYTNDHSLIKNAFLTSVLNSFVFDFILRCRLSGINVNYYVLSEAPLPDFDKLPHDILIYILKYLASLSFIHLKFAPDWLIAAKLNPNIRSISWKCNWALTNYQRLRLRIILDALIAHIYNLTLEEFEWILQDDVGNPKGFWRVDKDLPKEIRHTTLILNAYKFLLQEGVEGFCKKEWDIPLDIQKKYKEELGSRFLDWQLEQSVADSWKECEMHARNILGEDEFRVFMKDLEEGKDPFAIRAIQKEQERETQKSQKRKKAEKNPDQQSLSFPQDDSKKISLESAKPEKKQAIKEEKKVPATKNIKQKSLGDFLK